MPTFEVCHIWQLLSPAYINGLELFVGVELVGPRVCLDELHHSLLDALVRQNYVRPDLLACYWTDEVVFLLHAVITVLPVVRCAPSLILEVPQDDVLFVGLPALDHHWLFEGIICNRAEQVVRNFSCFAIFSCVLGQADSLDSFTQPFEFLITLSLSANML